MLSEDELRKLSAPKSEETFYEKFSKEFLSNTCDVAHRFADGHRLDKEFKIFLIDNRMLPEWGTEILWEAFVRTMERGTRAGVKNRKELGLMLLDELKNAGLCVLQDRTLYENDHFYHSGIREREMRRRETYDPSATRREARFTSRRVFVPEELGRAFLDIQTGEMRGNDEPEG